MNTNTSSTNVEPGKLFVGGLSWETTKESLKSYFEQFGEVCDSVIMVESDSKKPRGFGFIKFTDPCCVNKVLSKQEPHIVDDKTVDPKIAMVKGAEQVGGGSSPFPLKKIFVGGLSAGTSEETVREYFSQYGTVTDVDLKYDKATNRMRGFGFVGFDNEDTVDKVVQIHFHQVNGKTVEAKKAEPRNQQTKGQMPYPGATATTPSTSTAAYRGTYQYYGNSSYFPHAQAQYSPYSMKDAQYQYAGYGYGYGGQGNYATGSTGYSGTDQYGGGQQSSGSVASQQVASYSQDASGYPNSHVQQRYPTSEAGYRGQGGFAAYENSQTAPGGFTQPYGESQAASTYNRSIGQQQQRFY